MKAAFWREEMKIPLLWKMKKQAKVRAAQIAVGAAVLPILLYAYAEGPPPKLTAAPGDNGTGRGPPGHRAHHAGTHGTAAAQGNDRPIPRYTCPPVAQGTKRRIPRTKRGSGTILAGTGAAAGAAGRAANPAGCHETSSSAT